MSAEKQKVTVKAGCLLCGGLFSTYIKGGSATWHTTHFFSTVSTTVVCDPLLLYNTGNTRKVRAPNAV
jgi:hypothetical protein